jgi:hypothetical protein
MGIGAYGVGARVPGGVGAFEYGITSADLFVSVSQDNSHQNWNASPRGSQMNLGAGPPSPSPYGSDIDGRSMRSTGALINRDDGAASPYDPYSRGDGRRY